MKKLLTLFVLLIAFMTNAMAQWNQDPKIRETHWFGQYEYQDLYPDNFDSKTIDFDGNYLRSIEIVKTHTGQDWAKQHPKTSFYTWLDHKYRFSVGNTGAWGFRSNIKQRDFSTEARAYQNENLHYDWNGLSLANVSGNTTTFTILNLKAGDKINIEYYKNTNAWNGNVTLESGRVSGLSQGSEVASKTDYEVTADCNVTLNIPSKTMIRDVVITLDEYKASDFKVEEVKGAEAAALTSSHDAYLASKNVAQNDPRRRFGTLGYRYSFKGPGVLEDKRGAAPYITMKFGNDNDMTFVRALSEPTINWGDYQEVTPKLFTKNGGDDNGQESTADENGVYVVRSHDNPAQAWDTQFWIATDEYPLPAGQKFKIKFDYKADANASVDTQTHGATPGSYIHWACIGTLDFTTSWQTCEKEITISNDMAGWQSVAFNLNKSTSANKYYFRNISLQIPEKTETISDEDLGAASIIHESNDLDPTDKHMQCRWTYKNDDYNQLFTNDEIRDRLVGKEWSTFTADEDPNHRAHLNVNGEWLDSNGNTISNPTDPHAAEANGNTNYVYGDEFPTIWPLCGNFFYFFPEVDGLLEIEYYCEGSNETNAFWYKQTADGTSQYVEDQPLIQHINTQNGNMTSGVNNYKLMVQVERGGIYYLCSLPTNIAHERPIFRLKSYTFIPIFRVEPLYKVVKNTEVNTTATEKVAEIFGGPYTDLDGINHGYNNNSYDLANNTFERNAEPEARVKCLGNVVSAKAKVEYVGGHQYLSFYDIHFRGEDGSTNAAGEAYNPGGAVVAHVNNQEGEASFVLTIAYDAADAKWDVRDGKDTRVAATSNGEEVKHWDFYSGKGDYITKRGGIISYNGTESYTTEMNAGWNLGKYVEDDGTRYADDPNGWKAKSRLFKETHKADGLTADWEIDWVDVPNRKEIIFKSIYDMVADNADMIHETAGLVFFTDPNELGLYNENAAPTSEYQDRFIGLIGGGKLVIPRLKQNDRVVIKMGCFGNVVDKGESEFEQEAVLWLKNAKDAMGTDIPEETDYIIGGSEPFAEPAKALMYPHGEYHFMVKETSNSDDTDFTIQLKEGGLLKIYSIDIYRNAANDNADILTENVVTGLEPEMLFTDQDTEAKDMVCYLRYSGWQEKSEFHSLDQVRGNLASLSPTDFVGEEFTTQPYWKYTGESMFNFKDFGSFRAKMAVKTKDDANTFVTDYAPGCIAVDYLETMRYPYTWDFTDLVPLGDADDAIEEEQKRTDLLADYNGWKVVDGDDVITGLRNAPETEPGILFANGGQIYASDQMFAEAAGIGLKRSIEDPDEAYKLNNSVTVTEDGLVLNSTTEDQFHKLVIPMVPDTAAIYVRVTPIEDAEFSLAQYSTDGENGTDFGTPITAGDDLIYFMKNTAEQNVELWLNGVTVKKIGLSIDPKKLDAKGWATESRERVIDPDLTWYLTGSNIETVFVTGINYGAPGEAGTLTMSRVTTPGTEGNKALRASLNGDLGACLLHSIGGQAVSILDGGFHLFVPDMHDYPDVDLTANVSGGDKTLTTVDESLLKAQVTAGTVSATDGDYTNYILSDKHYQNGEGELQEGDEAFYRVSDKGAKTKGHNAYLQLETARVKPGVGATVFNMVFEADGIRETIANRAANSIFTINGMKLDEMPTTKGVYIVNGKKVIIK